MFFPAPAPTDRDVDDLRALRRSLNSPVVAIELLPSGPAAAVIVLHGGPADQPRVTIALRAARSGQLVFFTADEERAGFGSPGVAMDAALTFAESMGFLFDDDEVEALGVAGSEHAARIWRAFVSTDSGEGAPLAEGEPPEDLLLEEIDVLEPEPVIAVAKARETPKEVEIAHSEVEPEARAADLPGEAPDDVPSADEARQGRVDREAGWESVEEAEDPETLMIDPVLLLTKFRRIAGGSASSELSGGRPNAHIRVVSRF